MNHVNKFPKRDTSSTATAVEEPCVKFIQETCLEIEITYSILEKSVDSQLMSNYLAGILTS